uniref:HaPE560 alpha subunit n=1 Tax=Hemiselmis andersenii TaxID=464988 RepID=UPI00293DA213
AMRKDAKAPYVTVFDERDGCGGPTKAGGNSGDNKGLCVKVAMKKVAYGEGGVDRIGEMARDVFVNYDKQRGK